jgi:tight adherence protein C
MLYLSFFFTITLFVYSLFVFNQERNKSVKRRLRSITDSDARRQPDPAEEDNHDSARKLMILESWNRFKRSLMRKMSAAREMKMELRLLRAGRPYGMGPVEFRIMHITMMFLFPALFCFYGILLGVGAAGFILLVLAGFIVGTLLPTYYLAIKTKQRSRLALRELPDVVDLLTVSLEAGLGFDLALGKLVSKADGVLSAEFRRCLEELRLGKTRREALLGVRDRVPLNEIKVLISSILQAEKLGIGMVQVLRVQSQEVREQRKQRAEEAAMKAPIKMLFPLVLFIFPSLFIVLLGPAVIQFIETFSKM